MPQPAEQIAADVLEPYLRDQANRSITRGGLYVFVFCALSLPVMGLMKWLQPELLLFPPIASASCAGLTALVMWRLAVKGKLVGPTAWVSALVLASQPAALLVFAHLTVSPSGALTFLSGPAVILYVNLLIVTGLFFDPALSRAVGVICAVELLAWYGVERHLLSAPPLSPAVAALRGSAPMLAEDLFGASAAVMKAIMIACGGFFTAALASTARALITRVLAEEREKQGISRLFGQFVSPEVREKVLREKVDAAGERKNVVVLFSDIRGFTEWSEGTDPAVLVTQLNEYFDGMVSAITRNGGVVDKFIGDAVMAVFGGLIDLPNPCDAALKASVEMRQALDALNERWRKDGRPTLKNGIGIHYGEVLQGTIGSAERKEFTVIGDAVNTASRLESATKDLGKTTVLSAAVFGRLTDNSAVTSIGEIQLKGKTERVAVYGM